MPENTESPESLPQPSKFRNVCALILVAVLWIGLGFGLMPAWAVCTPWFQTNGVTFVGGIQSPGSNSNYDYYTYCTVFNPTTGAQTSPSAITWNTAEQTTLFKQTWLCSYHGHNETYFPINCTWQSNITAFWLTPAPGGNNPSVLILR